MKKNVSPKVFVVFILLLSTTSLAAYFFSATFSVQVTSAATKPVQGSKEWLAVKINAASKEGSAAFELAQHFASQLAYKESVLWFKQAIRLDYKSAHIKLAALYFSHEEFELAHKVLNSAVVPKDHAYNLLAIKVALALGEVDYIQSHYQHLSGFAEGEALLEKLIKYQVIAIEQGSHYVNQAIPALTCQNPIQFIATNLSDLAHSEALIKQVQEHPLAAYFCFTPVRYQPAEALKCRPLPNHFATQAIQCDESVWRDKLLPDNIRYLAVLLPEGGANVHQGILYLDRSDSLDVVLHELTHLLGFIDEYALPPGHIACDKNQQQAWAHNIAVLPASYQGSRERLREEILALLPWRTFIEADTPILQASDNGWLLGTPEGYSDKVGVFPSKTCELNVNKSFKPISAATMLTYNELAFPPLYLSLLAYRPEQYRMPSYHINVAKALWLKGEEQEAKRWFDLLQN